MGSLFTYSTPSYRPMSYSVPRAAPSKISEPPKQSGKSTQQSDEDVAKVEDVIRRTARGRNSTIQTSYRGVLTDQSTLTPKRKNLLGE